MDLLVNTIVAVLGLVLGYIVRPLIDDRLDARRESRREQAALRAEERAEQSAVRARERVVAAERNAEMIQAIDSVLQVVRALRDGRDPFRYGADDPLGTSGEGAFNAQLDALADGDRDKGIPVKRAVLKKDFDEAAILLREWRNGLQR